MKKLVVVLIALMCVGIGVMVIADSSVTLNTPVDGYNSTTLLNTLNCTATSQPTHNLTNVTLYTNATGNWLANATNTSTNDLINGTYVLFDITFPADGLYLWNCYGCANDSVCNFSSSNRTIFVDSTAPNSYLTSPVDGYNTTSSGVAFQYNSSDALDTSLNCNLTIDGVVNETSVVTSSSPVNVTTVIGFSEGSHTWNVSCWDNLNNLNYTETRTFTIDTTAPTTAPNITNVLDSNTDGNIEIVWSADANAMSYGLFRSTSVLNNSNTGGTRLLNTSVTTYVDNTTSNGTTYYYAVTSIDVMGNENTSMVNITNGLNSVAADDQVYPIQTNLVNVSGAGTNVSTLRWHNVTLDGNGKEDRWGLQFEVWKGTSVNGTAVQVNETSSGYSLEETISTNGTSDVITTSAVYHYVIVSKDDGGNRNYTIIRGNTGNYINVSLVYTAPTTPTSSSSSGGGGYVPTLAATSEVLASKGKVWAVLESNSPITWDIVESKIAVNKLKLESKKRHTSISLDVASVDKPGDLSLPERKVYQYLDIDSNIPNEDINEAVIEFKVEIAWLLQNNIKRANVRLLRYNNGWDVLSTKHLKDEGNYALFEGNTPGFSYFAVSSVEEEVDEQIVEEVIVEEPVREIEEEIVEEEEEADTKSSWGYWAIGILIIATAILIYIFGTKKHHLEAHPNHKGEKGYKKTRKKK